MDQEVFFNAIRQGDLEVVRTQLEKNPELIGNRDQRGSTPLILAAYYNHGPVVAYLLRKGAPVDEKDSSGSTALMGACFKGYVEIAQQLIAAGADINSSHPMGGSCLIFAVSFKQEAIARLLIAQGADLNGKDARGLTALDHAKMQGLKQLEALLTGTN